MPRIQCYYDDCRFLRDGVCHADIVEFTPEDGCLTFVIRVAPPQVNKWTDDDVIDIEDSWNDVGFEEKEEADYWDDDY